MTHRILTNPGLTPASHLTRAGTALLLHGQPHRLIGIDILSAFWGSRYAYSPELATALPALAGKVNVIRVFGVQASAITAGVRDWSDWDAALTLCAANGIRIIVALTNHWGGQPVSDSGATTRDIDWYTSGYRTTVEGVATYRDWVKEAVTRYRDNASIAYWVLANECQAENANQTCSTPEAKAALRAFADDMGQLVKSIDPNHLVGLGTQPSGCGCNNSDWGYVEGGPDMDIMDRHHYGTTNDGMPHPEDPLGDANAANGSTADFGYASAAGKVFITGEMGIHYLQASPPITRAARAAIFDARIAALLALGAQGVLLWEWHDAPVSSDPTRDWDICPDDPALPVLAAYLP